MAQRTVSEENCLIDPHGGVLVDLIVSRQRAVELEAEAVYLQKWVLTPRQLCDTEQMLTGAFSPLTGFMNRHDYQRVCDEMRLTNGILWPMPIVLDVSTRLAMSLSSGERLALMHPEGALIAVLTVGDIWKPDRLDEALKIFGTSDQYHSGVNALINETAEYYIGGSLEGVKASQHHTYEGLRYTPAQLRADFERREWHRIVAFQTRNPMHRAHVELTRRASEQVSANLLIHPVVGLTKPGDVEYHTRVRCYQAILGSYAENSVALSLLQLAMRMAGPREAVWHAIVRKNYGCTHFIVGRDHAGPGNDANGQPFYGSYDAQYLVEKYRNELEIEVVNFQEVVYDGMNGCYVTRDELGEDSKVMNLSGTELRNRLQDGTDIPEWFSFPSVIAELRKSYPETRERGFTISFVDDYLAANSMLGNAIAEMLLEEGSRPVTILDDPDLSDHTIDLVAREVTRNGGAVIAVPHGPHSEEELATRRDGNSEGIFITVHREDASRSDAEVDVEIDSKSSSGEGARVVMDHLASLGLIY